MAVDPGGIAGFISLSITLLQGCIQGFELLESAHHLGRDADSVRCMFQWEQHRLFQWAERAGLDGSPQPKAKLQWNVVADILGQLERLLSSTAKLKQRYHLDLEESDVEPVEQAQGSLPPSRQTGIRRLLARFRPDFYLAGARAIQAQNGPTKRLRWAVWDKEKARELVQDISYFNNCLHTLLETADQDFIRAALETLLRDVISESAVSSELNMIEQMPNSPYIASSSALAAAARVKQIRLIVGLDKKPDESPLGQPARDLSREEQPKLTKLKFSSLVRASPTAPRVGREVARYRSGPVLVEWKEVHRSERATLQPRLQGLALLLSNADDPSFHSLRCMGFMTDDTATHWAYVFEIPSVSPKGRVPSPLEVRPLVQLLRGHRLPSLDERWSIALALAQTVLQLHTAGWLHKGIRPHNILFIDVDDRLWDASTAMGPYLAGYEYSRLDAAVEQTETTPSSPEIDIYRHPNAHCASRPTFMKYFDLFALGCVLLEIALWMPLHDVLELNGLSQGKVGLAVDGLMRAENAHPVLTRVAFSAGTALRDVIKMCLTAGDRELGPLDEAQSPIDVQQSIVQRLTACHC